MPVAPHASERRGVIVVLAAACLVILFAFLAFSIDVGHVAKVDAELQTAADAAALAAADEMGSITPEVTQSAIDVANANMGGDTNIKLGQVAVEEGTFDYERKVFNVGGRFPNAVRVRTTAADQPLFFAPVLGVDTFDKEAEAIAMLNPRDIMFVVDLSGSMNDDTEPLWASKLIEDKYAGTPDAGIGVEMAQRLWQDFGFQFPGTHEHLGKSAEEFVLANDPGHPNPIVPEDDYAYAELTDDEGPLTSASIPAQYRIAVSDDEDTRKRKSYSWIIDTQIRRLMPAARPVADSTNAASYAYWERYIGYIVTSQYLADPTPPPPPPPPPSDPPPPPPGGTDPGDPPPPSDPPPPPPPPPSDPPPPPPPPRPIGNMVPSVGLMAQLTQSLPATTMPPGQPRRGATERVWAPEGAYEGNKLWSFNNPNRFTWGSTDTSFRDQFFNKIGYGTYVQFMLDFGRDRSPEAPNDINADENVPQKVQLSALSPYCRYHMENVDEQYFSFPPRTQPMHSCRRAMIRAIQFVKELNQSVAGGAADRVGIITFDGDDAYHTPEVLCPLTGNYGAAMTRCTTMQATSDIGATTATENALILAREHMAPGIEGGQGRPYAKRVIILLSDGVPNEWKSSTADMNQFMNDNPSPDFYTQDVPWVNAPLIQAAKFRMEDTEIHPVGIGLGTDYGFMDRMARLAETCDEDGQAQRGPVNPDDYEEELTRILKDVIKHPGTRLVQ